MNNRAVSFVVSGRTLLAGGLLVCGVAFAQSEPKVRTFGPGVHYLTEPIVLTAADSGTVWKAAPGAKPVISGARKVTGWRKTEGGLWCADVPWVTGRENGFRQLTVNGELRPRAKHPNADYFYSLEFPRPADVTWSQWEYSLLKPRFRINPGEVDPKWKLAKGEVIFYHLWNDSHCPAASLTVENGTNWVNLANAVKRNPCGCPWRLENLKEIADVPGEWALDYDEKRVYYRPCAGEDPTTAEIAVPFLEMLVKIDGAKDVRFEGLSFEDSRYELARTNRNDFQASSGVSAAVVLTNAVNCVFDRCAFRKLSGYAIDFKAGTCDSKVRHCRMVSLGAGGVRLNHAVPQFANTTTNLGYAAYQMPDPRDRVRGNEISDCEIGDYGRDFPSAVGVLVMHAEETKVVHNAIHDGYYTGVSVGWCWGYMPSVARDNLVEYNHIWNIGKGLISDMGGVYLLGIAPGTKVRNNLIHDVDARFYGGWGIYPDEGSSGLLIENNVVYNTKFANYHQHFGRNNTVRNNIFAGGKVDQLASSRWEPHTRFFFYNNIVYWREGKLHSGNWADDKLYPYLRIPLSFRKEPEIRLKKTTECDYNLYFNPTKELKDVVWGTQKCSWDDWRGKYHEDKHSVWGDPLFVDEANHDYRLRPDSPALKLGFRPIDLSTVGPRADSAAPSACSDARSSKISVFVNFVTTAAKQRGVTVEESAAMFYDLGVRGFDCSVFEPQLPRLAATKLKPINLYYFPKWSDEAGARAEDARALDAAVKYGVPRIMTIPPNFTDGGDQEAEFVRNTAKLASLVAAAKARGITITVEDFGGVKNACSHAKYLMRMLDAIPDLRFALDSGNLYYAGRGDDILKLMAFAKGRIAHVHLKDQLAEDNRKFVTLGLGAVPNEKIVKTTWADGYDGWYTLENSIGDVLDDTTRQVAVLKAWLARK